MLATETALIQLLYIRSTSSAISLSLSLFIFILLRFVLRLVRDFYLTRASQVRCTLLFVHVWLRTCSFVFYFFFFTFLSRDHTFDPASEIGTLSFRVAGMLISSRLSAMECELIVAPTNAHSAYIHTRASAQGVAKNSERARSLAKNIGYANIYRNPHILLSRPAPSGISTQSRRDHASSHCVMKPIVKTYAR